MGLSQPGLQIFPPEFGISAIDFHSSYIRDFVVKCGDRHRAADRNRVADDQGIWQALLDCDVFPQPFAILLWSMEFRLRHRWECRQGNGDDREQWM